MFLWKRNKLYAFSLVMGHKNRKRPDSTSGSVLCKRIIFEFLISERRGAERRAVTVRARNHSRLTLFLSSSSFIPSDYSTPFCRLPKLAFQFGPWKYWTLKIQQRTPFLELSINSDVSLISWEWAIKDQRFRKE